MSEIFIFPLDVTLSEAFFPRYIVNLKKENEIRAGLSNYTHEIW